MVFHPLTDFLAFPLADLAHPDWHLPIAWYEGECWRTGASLRLPRTRLAEAIAQGLMRQLATDDRDQREGKMYGILLVSDPEGQHWALKAFSGLLNGKRTVEGWVPPIPGHDRVALAEADTIARLDAIKQELIRLQQLPERQQLEQIQQQIAIERQHLNAHHRDRKLHRHQRRQQIRDTLPETEQAPAFAVLEAESQRDGMELRQFKRNWQLLQQPLQQCVDQANQTIRQLKHQRRQLSQQLQHQMHAAYWLTNFSGDSLALQHLKASGALPTGTGDCCAPKLLHYAATHDLTPVTLAEFWWGAATSTGDRVEGQFYEACADRCQPLLGFLLAGIGKQPSSPSVSSDDLEQSRSEPEFIRHPFLSDIPRESHRFDSDTSPIHSFQRPSDSHLIDSSLSVFNPLSILYIDNWLVAIDKPAGLLSVPGRYRATQDCAIERLRHQLQQVSGQEEALFAVHRLDQDTSGVLMIARSRAAQRQLTQQFAQRQVQKLYEALLEGRIAADSGEIDLPLWGDPTQRPRQQVDWQRGKPSQTRFRVVQRGQRSTQVEFQPVTGRTHQLRVHAADPQGLAAPIWGDRLYGAIPAVDAGETQPSRDRLYLHARELWIDHPQTGERLRLETETPFRLGAED